MNLIYRLCGYKYQLHMTNSPEPNQPERDLRRRIREMDWRIQRLEATQMPAKSIDEAFQQVYDELDELQDKSDATRADISSMKVDVARLEGRSILFCSISRV
jgi:septal ring factor EnvC (AmiA/AmiB activator)